MYNFGFIKPAAFSTARTNRKIKRKRHYRSNGVLLSSFICIDYIIDTVILIQPLIVTVIIILLQKFILSFHNVFRHLKK